MLQTKPFKAICKYLKYKTMYLKYFYQFIFAHKPLCENFKKDTLLLFNNIYVCRSCLYLYVGAALSFIVTYCLLSANLFYKNIILISSFILTILLISNPKFYKKYSRWQRDIVRFFTGTIIGLTLTIPFKINFLIGSLLIVTLFAIKQLYAKQRNKVDICENCEELINGKTCSGYKKQVKALLVLEEEYSKTLTIRKELLYDK